jgi:hypothetical protein
VWAEVRSADGEVRSGPWPAMWSTAFELATPWRGFPSFRGQSNFPGWWWSATTGGHVGYESWLERDHVMLLDFDRRVAGLSSQPFRLSWDAGGVRRRHIPDFFARLADGSGVVVDVRADDRIGPRDAAAFEATARACEVAGWQFRRVGAVPPVLLANVRWLAGYRHPRHAGQVTAPVVRGVFGAGVPLIEGARLLGDPVAVLAGVYHWLWRGELLADGLERVPLSMATMVSVSGPATGPSRVNRMVRWSG